MHCTGTTADQILLAAASGHSAVNIERLLSHRGFSLPELLIALTVLAIVTNYAIAAWREQIIKTRRSEARALLMQIAARQEQFRLQALRYANGAELGAAPPAGLGVDGNGSNYRLTTTATVNDFQATATVQTGGAQADDTYCWLFGIDSTGQRWAENRTGTDTSEQCWR
jgi:type IV pilus assembly protein PilE